MGFAKEDWLTALFVFKYLFWFSRPYFLEDENSPLLSANEDILDSINCKNGWSSIWLAVILFEGYHLRHSLIKSIPSGGQFVIIDSSGIGEYYGKLIPFFTACFWPSGHTLGVPKIDVILLTWSIYEIPWKRGLIIYISAIMQPNAKTSTGAEYAENLNSIYGARYHLVDT